MKPTLATKPISAKIIKREWHLIDMEKKILGRHIDKIVNFLIGKNKVNYSPNLDMGDNVVVINASKVVLSGKKEINKVYTNYSGYPSGLRKTEYKRLLESHPEKIVLNVVSGMLPKNKLRKKRLARLYIFPLKEHRFTDKFIKSLTPEK